MTTKRQHGKTARWAVLALTQTLMMAAGCGDEDPAKIDTEPLPSDGTGTAGVATMDDTGGDAGATMATAAASSGALTRGTTTSSETDATVGDTGATGHESGSTGAGATTGSVAMLEIAGSYVDDFGATHEVSEMQWLTSGQGYEARFVVDHYDNDLDYLVAQNDANNAFNPALWSRFVWTVDDVGQLWYCQSPFGAESPETAEAAALPDSTMPETGGCGGFPWSALEPAG